jgi:hypothetical protein
MSVMDVVRDVVRDEIELDVQPAIVDEEAVVRAFYDRVVALHDGDEWVIPDLDDLERTIAADTRVLSGVLAAPAVVRPVARGLLLTRPDLVRRHLGAALVAAGLPRSVVLDVALAYVRVTGQDVVVEAVGAPG